MNYIGSKKSLLPFIEKIIKEVVGDIGDKIFFDLFAGTGAVGSYFNKKVKQVIASDTEEYSYILNHNLLKSFSSPDLDGYEYINSLPPVEGFIWKHYSPAGGRMYFTEENAKKIDAVRKAVFPLPKVDRIPYLAALLESADRVANTTSVYAAYLKEFKKTALSQFVLEPAESVISAGEYNNVVLQGDAEELSEILICDILYLDPPYNNRQYGANYHLLNTLVTDKEFEPQGITGLSPNYYKSKFCSKSTVIESFSNIINNTNAEHIFLSYNNEGLMTPEQVKEIMSCYGDYKVFSTNYKTYKADNNRDNKSAETIEYLHHLHKK